MAHERTELTLGPGVTALTGPNNTGKSAVVEGLRCVATNPMPKNYIRHGAKEARVSVELEDGTRVVWIRKKRSSGYELWAPGAEEPEEFWKFGRKPPEDILAALRLDVVALEGDKEIDVHIGNQREPVFLLNRPDSDAAAFFAASSESAHLLAMQNLLKRKTQDAKRNERGLEARLAEIETAMDGLSLLPDLAVTLERARELESAASRLQSEIPAVEKLLSRLAQTRSGLDRCRETTSVYKAVSSPPEINEVKGLDFIIHQMGRIEKSLARVREADRALGPVGPPPAPFDTVRLATLCNRLQHLDATLRKQAEADAALASLRPMAEPEKVDQLAGILSGIELCEARMRSVDKTWHVLRSLEEAPEVRDDPRLAGMVADLRGLDGALDAARTRHAGLETELQSVRDAIRRTVDVLGKCPTCGADLNTEVFLDQEAGHDA